MRGIKSGQAGSRQRSRRRGAAALGVAVLLAAIALAAVPIPGPGWEEVCAAHASGDRGQLQSVATDLRFGGLSAFARVREAWSPVTAPDACVARSFWRRPELQRLCAASRPLTEPEAELARLSFERAYLESYRACLLEMRDDLVAGGR